MLQLGFHLFVHFFPSTLGRNHTHGRVVLPPGTFLRALYQLSYTAAAFEDTSSFNYYTCLISFYSIHSKLWTLSTYSIIRPWASSQKERFLYLAFSFSFLLIIKLFWQHNTTKLQNKSKWDFQSCQWLKTSRLPFPEQQLNFFSFISNLIGKVYFFQFSF